MSFTPFMQSSNAQNIINQYLNNPTSTQTTGAFRNPYFDLRTEQGLPADAMYPDPLVDFSVEDVPLDPCPPGYELIDGICQPIIEYGQSIYDDGSGDGDGGNTDDVLTFSEDQYKKMAKDPTNPYGAGKELDKWEIDEDEFGNTVYKYKDKGFTPTLFGIADAITGGNAKRKDRFNTAVNTILGQTINPNFFAQNYNPLAFGFSSGDTFTKYSPQNYLQQTQDVEIPGSNQGATMGELLGSVGQGMQGSGDGYVAPTQQVNSGQQGTQVSNNLGGILNNAGQRDDTAYQYAIAQNIAKNLSNFDSAVGKPKSTESTGSGFSKSLGGFYKGR